MFFNIPKEKMLLCIFDFNKGTYLKYALIDFINKNKINNNDNIINDMPNINFQNNLKF